jgi:hypothetical protein
MDERLKEQWKSVAIEIHNRVVNLVNMPEHMGTEDETGVVLMFFNARNHQGQSTMVTSDIKDRASIKLILKNALRRVASAEAINQTKGHC